MGFGGSHGSVSTRLVISWGHVFSFCGSRSNRTGNHLMKRNDTGRSV